MSRELLARAWAAGAGPGDAPFTIDLDSTVCETYELAKEGARHHGYTGKRGYHPLLAIAAGTGDVLMSRLREGRANTACGAAHFLRETVGRVRYAGANGRLTLRADSGFYTHGVVSVCREMDVRFSITIRQHKSLRNLIEAIPEDAWTPIPYWMDGAADVAETTSARGACHVCGAAAVTAKHCPRHRDLNNAAALARKLARQAAGLCRRCPWPAETRDFCRRHREMDAARQRTRYRQRDGDPHPVAAASTRRAARQPRQPRQPRQQG